MIVLGMEGGNGVAEHWSGGAMGRKNNILLSRLGGAAPRAAINEFAPLPRWASYFDMPVHEQHNSPVEMTEGMRRYRPAPSTIADEPIIGRILCDREQGIYAARGVWHPRVDQQRRIGRGSCVRVRPTNSQELAPVIRFIGGSSIASGRGNLARPIGVNEIAGAAIVIAVRGPLPARGGLLV